jgi:CBS domain-containing protein/ribosome-associated translation inhibitor RaiA
MDISDIATRDYAEVGADERIGKVRSLFEDETLKGIIVKRDGTGGGEYAGVLTQRQLLQSHVEDSSKVGALVTPETRSVPKVSRTEDIRKTARVLVEGNTRVAPVFEGDRLWGIVTADDVLEAVLENLDALDVADIYSQNVITIQEDDSMGTVINRLRENGISRLPVLDDRDVLTGVVTTHDVIAFATRNVEKTTRGDRAGERQQLLDLPVYDVMSSPVETITATESVKDAVEIMLDNGYDGLIVTQGDDDRYVDGVVTKTDVLRALTYTEEDHLNVQITNIDLLDTLPRQEIRERIEEVADKYSEMQVQHAHVRFHRHKEKLRGTPLLMCQIRMRTNKGEVAGSGEGYGADNAFYVALDHLERNTIEMKGIQRDEAYEGQLMRKLGEL